MASEGLSGESAPHEEAAPVRDPLERRRAYVGTLSGFTYKLELLTPRAGALVREGQSLACAGVVRNTSGTDWRGEVDGLACLELGAEVHSVATGEKVDSVRVSVDRDVFRTGETWTFSFDIPAHAYAPDEYRLSLDLLYAHVCWFSSRTGIEKTTVNFVTIGRAAPAAPADDGELRRMQGALLQLRIEEEIRRIQERALERDGTALIASGFQVYSQCDEDGILEEIFRRIGVSNRVCCEIGCGNGLVNNTHYLVVQGWKGVWIDGDDRNIRNILEHVPVGPNDGLSVQKAFITRDNVNEVVRKGLADILGTMPREPYPIDLLSLDIDGNDLHVLERLDAVEARVICVEYNAKFPPPARLTIQYDAEHIWDLDDYQGASLQAFVDLLRPKGYRLVSCNSSGVNAFFVRESELRDITPMPVEDLYQPPRYDLIYRSRGHKRSYRYLIDRLNRNSDSGE